VVAYYFDKNKLRSYKVPGKDETIPGSCIEAVTKQSFFQITA